MRTEGTPQNYLHIEKGGVRRIDQVRLGELGITPTYDPLGLADEPLTLIATEPDAGAKRRMLVISPHPFAGEHAAQLMDINAPFHFPGKDNIINDIILPIFGEQRIARNDDPQNPYIHLHVMHRDDPVIGPAYNEFAASSMRPMLRALRSTAGDSVFGQVHRTRFINNVQEFADQFYTDVALVAAGKLTGTLADRRIYDIGSCFLRSKLSISFLDLAHEEAGIRDSNIMLMEYNYHDLPWEQKSALQLKFLEMMSDEDRRNFALQSAGRFKGELIVDLDAQEILLPAKEGTRARFVDDQVVEFTSPDGAMAQIVPYQYEGFGMTMYKVIKSQFPPAYLYSARYPAFGWEVDQDGNRRMLKQKEVSAIAYTQFGSSKWADAVFGQMWATYFFQGKEDWNKTGRLEQSEKTQQMMGAQVPLWAPHGSNGKALLAENPLVSSVENRLVQ